MFQFVVTYTQDPQEEKGLGDTENSPVSQICKRTMVSVSESTTRFVRKLAPTVDVIWDGLKAPLQ